MFQPFLIGALAGLRAMTPLAAVALAGRLGRLQPHDAPPRLLFRPGLAEGIAALAAAELVGDKLPLAPDRTVAPGMAARLLTGALAAFVLSPREERWIAAGAAAAAAAGTAHLGLRARQAAMARGGQIPTGLAEDALLLAATAAILRSAIRAGRG